MHFSSIARIVRLKKKCGLGSEVTNVTDLSLKQYYAHREKLKLVNRETDLKAMNMKALQIAREVADETGTLMAGNICNSTIYKKGDEAAISKAHDMFKVQWVNH